ncbi:MAG: acyl transferase [Chlorobi bacterium]|nr:acyl transferase [Chlorobiota bacterium]
MTSNLDFTPDYAIRLLENPTLEAWKEVYAVHSKHNNVYHQWLNLVKRQPNPIEIQSVEDIPHLPISAFKHHKIILDGFKEKLVFRSSGTTGLRSKHYVAFPEVYLWSLYHGFKLHFGNPEEYWHIALLPGYEERPDSSLIYMVKRLMEHAGQAASEFFVGLKPEKLIPLLGSLPSNRKIILWSVPYALLDLVQKNIKLPSDITIIETGGMKGRGPEWSRQQLHEYLQQNLGVKTILSEYGMTELLSQAYTTPEKPFRFKTPPWMKVWTRDLYVPFKKAPYGKAGVLCIADLANVFSVPFIETEDIGIVYEDGTFEVLGRLEYCEIRGCNLLYEEFG